MKRSAYQKKSVVLNVFSSSWCSKSVYTVAFATAKACLQWSNDNMCAHTLSDPVWKCTSLQDLGWRINGRTADCSRQQRRAKRLAFAFNHTLVCCLFPLFIIYFIGNQTYEKTAFIPPKKLKNLLKSHSISNAKEKLHGYWLKRSWIWGHTE